MYRNPLIKGMTTNPTLMKKAGISNYEGRRIPHRSPAGHHSAATRAAPCRYANSPLIASPYRVIITGRPVGVWYSLRESMPIAR